MRATMKSPLIPATPLDTDAHTLVPLATKERLPAEQIDRQRDRLVEMEMVWELISALPNILMVLNQQRQIVFTNESLFASLKIEPEQVLGRRPGEVWDCAHAFESPDGCGTTPYCQACGAARALVISLGGESSVEECRIVQKDGGALDLRVWGTPLTFDGETYAIFTMQDISHEKRRSALESIFFHDVLNLAGVLMGYADLLETVTSLDEVAHIQRTMLQTSLRLVDTIQTQRDLAAAERGELAVHPTPVWTAHVLHGVVARYAGHDVARDNAPVIAPDAVNVLVETDPVLLERVLDNMVKNALEASAPGYPVTLSCAADDGHVQFAVHNHTGMPYDVQLQVFQRSFSTKGTGRGLGTYSMRLLTEEYLHGTITFVSSREAGTTFTASFPVKFPAAERLILAAEMSPHAESVP